MTTSTEITDLVSAVEAVRERDEAIADLLRERDEQRVKFEEAVAAATVATAGAVEAERRLAAFRDSVRDAAIEVQQGHSRHISVGALNTWLTDLDLEPVECEWQVEVTVTRTWRGTVVVSAMSDEDAGEQAKAGFENDDFQADHHLEEDESDFRVEVDDVTSVS